VHYYPSERSMEICSAWTFPVRKEESISLTNKHNTG
jgi:hypothetical protein